MKVIFYFHGDIKYFSIFIVSYRYVQITQNNKLLTLLQYLKKQVSDEVHFLHADKYESFLQIDTMIFDVDGLKFQCS